MYYLVSLLFGLLPEVLYFTFFIVYAKNIKEKRIKLFCLIAIEYLICIFISQYKILYYLIFMFSIYIALKLLYQKKTQITDIFIISLSFLYMSILSYILLLLMKADKSNYFILYGINRVLMFIPFIFRNKFNKIYKKYYSLWNRSYEIKKPIKSITLRNCSLILLNFLIFFMNIIIISIINFK